MEGEIVRCSECSDCAVGFEAGFLGGEVLMCVPRDMQEVGASDGCTLGAPGAPQRAVADIAVELSDRAAVNGW